MIRQLSLTLAASLLVAATAPAQQSTGTRSTVRSGGGGATMVYGRNDGDRLVLGLSTSSGGPRDTLGLLVTSIAAGGPAEKAGLEEGNRLVSINGVALRLNASDAADPEMSGVLGRRFQRELEKVKAGDAVTIGVYSNGQTREVKITPVRADELSPLGMGRSRLDTRATIGASLGGFSSPRDTLGVFVISVAEDGPLAKAGIFEGSRIARINGVDLRVPAADVGDEFMTSSRIRRLTREVEKLEPGGNAELRVYTNGQYRDVTVKTVKRSDLKRDNAVSIFQSGGFGVVAPPMGLRLDENSRLRFEMDHLFDGEMRERIENALRGVDIERRGQREIWREEAEARERAEQRPLIRERSGGGEETIPVEDVLKQLQQRLRENETQVRIPFRTTSVVPATDVMALGTAGQFSGSIVFQPSVIATHDGYAYGYQANDLQSVQTPSEAAAAAQGRSGGTSRFRISKPSEQGTAFSLDGIRMSPINSSLASYLGRGSERGLLILEIADDWTGLLAGDVLLSVDGKAVRTGEAIDVGFDPSKEQCVEVLRERTTVKAVLRRR